MNQRFSNAIVVSALLHGAAIALVLVITYLAARQSGKPLDFFELVAGAGDNFNATEAPALGTPEGSPANAAPPATPAPTMVMTTTAPAAPKDVDFSKSVKASETKAATKLAAQAAKEKAAEEKAAKEEAARQAKMSKEDFDKQAKSKATPAPAAKANAPKVDAKGIAGGVVGGSTANTKGGAGGNALTASQRGVVEAYTQGLIERLRQNLDDQKPPGLSDTLVATASMQMRPDGTLFGGTIVKSSGNREFDKAVLDAIRLTKMPQRPSGFETGTFTLDFKARDKANE